MAGLKKTYRNFRAALKGHDEENAHLDGAIVKTGGVPTSPLRRSRRAAFAAWWFIENVREDDPSRYDIFFEVREIVRQSW